MNGCYLKNKSVRDTLLYARAALRNFEVYEGRATDMEDRTKGLIEWIEGKMKPSTNGSHE